MSHIISIDTPEVELCVYRLIDGSDYFEVIIRDLIDDNTIERYVVKTEKEVAQIANNFVNSLFGSVGA